jgi:hypothetical protein
MSWQLLRLDDRGWRVGVGSGPGLTPESGLSGSGHANAGVQAAEARPSFDLGVPFPAQASGLAPIELVN